MRSRRRRHPQGMRVSPCDSDRSSRTTPRRSRPRRRRTRPPARLRLLTAARLDPGRRPAPALAAGPVGRGHRRRGMPAGRRHERAGGPEGEGHAAGGREGQGGRDRTARRGRRRGGAGEDAVAGRASHSAACAWVRGEIVELALADDSGEGYVVRTVDPDSGVGAVTPGRRRQHGRSCASRGGGKFSLQRILTPQYYLSGGGGLRRASGRRSRPKRNLSAR
jgi:hypothetical protein